MPDYVQQPSARAGFGDLRWCRRLVRPSRVNPAGCRPAPALSHDRALGPEIRDDAGAGLHSTSARQARNKYGGSRPRARLDHGEPIRTDRIGLVCGHPDSGPFGKFLNYGPIEHCGSDRTKFKQHPLRNTDGSLGPVSTVASTDRKSVV